MTSRATSAPFRSGVDATQMRTTLDVAPFASVCPEDKTFKIEDLMAFRRGRGDLVFSAIVLMIALFFGMMFFRHTGWAGRDLPDDMLTYLGRQFGLADGEGRLDRFGRILKQSWVAPLACLLILIPAAALNMRSSYKNHLWRKRFGQPTNAGFEVIQWLRALEFVGWFVAYTLLVPILGYLCATLIFGTVLPWRMGYRSGRWFAICLTTSLAIVLVFRTGLQIKTPVNIWLYNLLPPRAEGFMQTWF